MKNIESYPAFNRFRLTKKRNFKKLCLEYYHAKNEENQEVINEIDLTIPLIKDAFEKLGAKVINSCKFNEKAIRDKLYLTSSESTELIKHLVIEKLDTNRFYTLAEVKELLTKIYTQLNIKGKPKGKDIGKILTNSNITPIFTTKVINGKNNEIVRF